MDWQDGPAPQTGAAVQVFDVGFLRHALIDSLDAPDEAAIAASYAASDFGAGPVRNVRLCCFVDGQPTGQPWQARAGAPIPAPAQSPVRLALRELEREQERAQERKP